MRREGCTKWTRDRASRHRRPISVVLAPIQTVQQMPVRDSEEELLVRSVVQEDHQDPAGPNDGPSTMPSTSAWQPQGADAG